MRRRKSSSTMKESREYLLMLGQYDEQLFPALAWRYCKFVTMVEAVKSPSSLGFRSSVNTSVWQPSTRPLPNPSDSTSTWHRKPRKMTPDRRNTHEKATRFKRRAMLMMASMIYDLDLVHGFELEYTKVLAVDVCHHATRRVQFLCKCGTWVTVGL